MGDRGRFSRRTYYDRVESYYHVPREDDVAREASEYHGPIRRRTRVWVAGLFLAALIGFFVYAVASDDPDSCVGNSIRTDTACDLKQP